ncbi:MAG: serine hydrolase [Candidatus Kapabacteria bacterium]|nr:serine hydrolase [Ignavibacteriota bacterium]MCW5886226.1 serine hydrolase [Candidatus Kapabacteria bacterium]
MRILITFFVIILIATVTINADELYFPPIVIGQKWETTSPEELGWNTDKIPVLFNYLEDKKSKGFIVLKDGKIVLEKYFGNFTQDSNWYWASAGKTLTAALAGLAQEEGFLNINDKTSIYLGESWTSLTKDKEDLITIRNQLTMTTGLDFNVESTDCTEPECLKYKADAGSQWYYHNAPYTLIENVIEEASGESYNQYFFRKIRNRIGMNGAWFKIGYNNVYFSTPRSMARFGLLMLGNGKWGETEIFSDKNYLFDMINTSNDLNKSYGYLWWLNGKGSFMVPQTSLVFKGMLFSEAPEDAYAALGKDGQCLHVSPSTGIVWVRMGEDPGENLFVSKDFSSNIWKYLNDIMNTEMSVYESENNFYVSPNPASDFITIQFSNKGLQPFAATEKVQLFDMLGLEVMSVGTGLDLSTQRIDVSHLPAGVYFIRIGDKVEKFVKM